MNDLSDYRKSYEKSELLESQIPEDPINLFNRWFHEVEDFGGVEESAQKIATIIKEFGLTRFSAHMDVGNSAHQDMMNSIKICRTNCSESKEIIEIA